MGFLSALGKLVHGDVKGAVDHLYIDDENADRGAKAEAIGEKLNNDRYQAGLISWQQLQERNDRIQSGTTAAMLANPELSPWEGFKEGAKDGLTNIQGGIKKTLGAPISFALGAIPWQIWLIGGIWLLWKLGYLQKWFRAK